MDDWKTKKNKIKSNVFWPIEIFTLIPLVGDHQKEYIDYLPYLLKYSSVKDFQVRGI